MPHFLYLFSFIKYITEHENMVGSHDRLADVLSVFIGFLGSNHIAVMRNVPGWFFNEEQLVFKITVSSGNFWSSPYLGLEPATHTLEALAERYLNGSERILDILSFRPSTSSSL